MRQSKPVDQRRGPVINARRRGTTPSQKDQRRALTYRAVADRPPRDVDRPDWGGHSVRPGHGPGRPGSQQAAHQHRETYPSRHDLSLRSIAPERSSHGNARLSRPCAGSGSLLPEWVTPSPTIRLVGRTHDQFDIWFEQDMAERRRAAPDGGRARDGGLRRRRWRHRFVHRDDLYIQRQHDRLWYDRHPAASEPGGVTAGN